MLNARISNALRYGSLLIARIAQYSVLTVEDNGSGMEARGLSQLFTRFKRFHNHVEGSGIGLYMVKKMVENAGGHIEVDSRVGVGSAFRVCLRRWAHPGKAGERGFISVQ